MHVHSLLVLLVFLTVQISGDISIRNVTNEKSSTREQHESSTTRNAIHVELSMTTTQPTTANVQHTATITDQAQTTTQPPVSTTQVTTTTQKVATEQLDQTQTTEKPFQAQMTEQMDQTETIAQMSLTKTTEQLDQTQTIEQMAQTQTTEQMVSNQTTEQLDRTVTMEKLNQIQTSPQLNQTQTMEQLDQTETPGPLDHTEQTQTKEQLNQTLTTEQLTQTQTTQQLATRWELKTSTTIITEKSDGTGAEFEMWYLAFIIPLVLIAFVAKCVHFEFCKRKRSSGNGGNSDAERAGNNVETRIHTKDYRSKQTTWKQYMLFTTEKTIQCFMEVSKKALTQRAKNKTANTWPKKNLLLE